MVSAHQIDAKVKLTFMRIDKNENLSSLYLAPTCNDGVRNQDETDIDCGGDSCPKCHDSRICKVGQDCTSGVCTSNICQGKIRDTLLNAFEIWIIT